ncbi:MAG: flavodoxin domain-containing protein [Bacteroidetes bacterium]|nr:flavodoxin domain-containing protein [Bacteroidota bacterium]MBS1758139.1 flavodoxin domain-containing protein [Bacteroidota bacterium]
MLAEPKLKLLHEHIRSYTKEELIWVNGFISGLINESIAPIPSVADKNLPAKKITLAYGTETGNSKKLATGLAAKAKQKGIQARLVSLDQYRLPDLHKEEYFITVISTQGEGEPPVAAQKFYNHIHNNGFKIPEMKYAVLALGDTSYPMFCKTGEDVDIQLENIGAKRIAPMIKCDLDYEKPAEQWFDQLLDSINNISSPEIKITAAAPAITEKKAGKKFYTGTILAHINLNATGSDKTTYHLEIAADDVEYLPGDSIGIVPENDELVVDEIIMLSGIDGNKTVSFKNEEASLREHLLQKINISFLLEKFIKQYADLVQAEIPTTRVDLIQLLRKYPLKNSEAFEKFLLLLHPIAPRIYNIASSINAHGNEVHIIALHNDFIVNGQQKNGLCTDFISNKKEGDTIQFFVQVNKRFRLPDSDQNIIMIGPGTGIAPFRSFVAERDATGATGKNWLFFGEEKFTTDFYYQTEWQNWFSSSVLTNINLAFSEQGIYVQDKLMQKASELFEWINNGASIYLCGDKDTMSKAVESTLIKIFEQEGKLSNEAALQYFEALKSNGKYMKDVY